MGSDREGKGKLGKKTSGSDPCSTQSNNQARAVPPTRQAKVGAPAGAKPSCFAPVERATTPELERTIYLVAQSPVTTALLRSATSMMCVLNEHRQIVTLNTAYLDSLDVAHADDVIGLRPGEAIKCTHANDHSGGCGTSEHCQGCDVAIAILASQQSRRAVQRQCVVSVRDRKGARRDMSLAIRASPFELEGERFTVFCMTDISLQKLHAGLERSFLHDLSNLVTGLAASSETLRQSGPTNTGSLVNDICELSTRLSREIIIQRLLLSRDPAKHRPTWKCVSISETLAFLERLFSNHPSAAMKRLTINGLTSSDDCITDPSLLERILTNMLMNAFEATTAGHEVRLTAESSATKLHFTVWNAESMTAAVAERVFQRHFSTKKGLGRGQGTYAIRLLGETLLHGKVGFTSSPENGTAFFLDLPRNGQPVSDAGRLHSKANKG
jgi:K+-sensing histidine kinase KdpD